MARRSAQRPAHRPEPISQADAARLRGVARSSVCRSARPGGALHAAVLPGGRIDRAHPACQRWLRAAPAAPLLVVETALTFEQAARQSGVSLAELKKAVRGALRDAVIPSAHVSASEFAERAGVELDVVVAAVGAELAPALTPSGRLDLKHKASLAFSAARGPR